MIQILPGTHIDVVAGSRAAQLSVTGIVAMPLEMDWGDKVTIINQGDSTAISLGYDTANVKLKCVKEVMNYATKLILYRSNLTGALEATGTLAAEITATAKHAGIRGNDISVVVAAVDTNFSIKTYLDGVLKDTQTVADETNFTANDWITITGSGTLVAATVSLTGGANGTVDATTDAFTTELQKYQYNVIAYTGINSASITGLINFVNDQRVKNNMIQLVESGTAADNVAVYNCMSGGVTIDYTLTAPEACATLAGIVAKQGITGSLTHFNSIIGWTDIETPLTYEQQQAAVTAGQLIVVMLYGTPTVLYDINSLTIYTDTAPKDFTKGLVIRTLDNYAINLQKLLDTQAIGKIRNSVSGRSLIKGMVATMTTTNYLDNGYIEDFTADDVSVSEGTDRDAVTATVGIKVTDTVDKINVIVTAL